MGVNPITGRNQESPPGVDVIGSSNINNTTAATPAPSAALGHHPDAAYGVLRAAGNAQAAKLLTAIQTAIKIGLEESHAIDDPALTVRSKPASAILRPEPDLNFVTDVATGFMRVASNETAGSSTRTNAMLKATSHAFKARLKGNGYGPDATHRELNTGAFYYFLYYPHAPHVSAAMHSDAHLDLDKTTSDTFVGILSRMMDGFIDFGKFLLSPSKMMANLRPEQEVEYYQKLHLHHQVIATMGRVEIILASSSDELAGCVGKHAKAAMRRLDSISEQTKREMQPLRDLGRIAGYLRDEMAAMLPKEARSLITKALYKSESVADLDFQNHMHYNGGFILMGKKAHAAGQVDHGLGGKSGPGGKTKENSRESLKQPARLDDPFLFYGFTEAYPLSASQDLFRAYGYPARFNKHLYGDKSIVDLDIATNPRNISSSYGLVGTMPRAGIYAGYMRNIIKAQTEQDTRPPEMLETAYRLKQFSRQEIRDFHGMLRDQRLASGDPALIAMEQNSEQDWPEEYADMYTERFAKLILRAGSATGASMIEEEQNQSPETGLTTDWEYRVSHTPLPYLDQWADKNPEQAHQIRIETGIMKNELAKKRGTGPLPLSSRSELNLNRLVLRDQLDQGLIEEADDAPLPERMGASVPNLLDISANDGPPGPLQNR